MTKTCFSQFLIFYKKSRNTNEKLIPEMESPDFFWSPFQISCLGKVWFIQKWGLIDPNWRVFLRFLTILNEPILKKYMCEQNDFLDTERDTWGLLTLKISATELQWIMKNGRLGFYTFGMIQKCFTGFLLFFTQNRSIRKNNMFWAILRGRLFSPK